MNTLSLWIAKLKWTHRCQLLNLAESKCFTVLKSWMDEKGKYLGCGGVRQMGTVQWKYVQFASYAQMQ